MFSKLKFWGANPQRLDSSVEPEVVVCVRSGSYTFGEQRPMHHTERSRVSPMHHGPGKWRSKTTRGGLAMAPRGIGTSHGVCRTTRVPCADLPRFVFYTAVSAIFRGLGFEPALLLLLRAQPWPSGENMHTYFASRALFFEYRSYKWVRSIRRVPPDRSHLVLAQTDKNKCLTRQIRVHIPS